MKTLRFYTSDLSAGHLILVNPSHPLKADRKRETLAPARPGAAGILLEREAAEMLTRIMTLLMCEDRITPVSGYRTMEEQRSIYKDALREYGEAFTRSYVAIPGCSEHQTGLAVDLAERRGEIDFLRPDFPYTGICGRFRELAAEYGFIERYPAGRENITRIAHEPWHFRYVGYPHSQRMKEQAMTLEEYTSYLRQFSYTGEHLCFRCGEEELELFHVPVPSAGEAAIEIPDGMRHQVSGNNVDGVVVTLWRRGS